MSKIKELWKMWKTTELLRMDKNKLLFMACVEGDKKMVIQMIDEGVDDLENTLCYAYSKGHLDIVEMLIEKYFYSLNSLNTYLYYAFKDRHSNIIKLLIKKGANNLRKHFGTLPMQICYLKNGAGDFDQELYEILVEKQCPLYYIITHKHVSKTLNKIPMDLWRYLKDFLN